MSINPIKEFFKKKKAEIKFARAGPGQKLSEGRAEQSTSSDSQSARRAAADAAMKRFNKDDSKPDPRPRLAGSDSKPKQTTQRKQDAPEDDVQIVGSVVQKELPVIDGVPQRTVQIYSKEEFAQRIKQPEIDDDFFRLTVEDAKLFQQRYNEERARNEILKTSEMRKRESESKKPTTNIARLRFKLPNESVIEACFSGSETLAIVKDWLISTCLEKLQLKLDNIDVLMGLKPFKQDDFKKSLKQLGLLPATTLTIIRRNN